MSRDRASLSGRRITLIVLLALTPVSCTQWGRSGPVPAPEAGNHLGRVALTLKEGGLVELWNASFQSDSVVGYLSGGASAGRFAYHRNDIASVRRRELSPVKTAGAIALGGVGTALVLLILISSAISDVGY